WNISILTRTSPVNQQQPTKWTIWRSACQLPVRKRRASSRPPIRREGDSLGADAVAGTDERWFGLWALSLCRGLVLMQVCFCRHGLDASSVEAIARVIETPFITSGTVGREVEAQLTSYFGVAHAALVNSWTNGAIAALLALDVRPGDEIIIPAMTF